jgi:hypothetical protein
MIFSAKEEKSMWASVEHCWHSYFLRKMKLYALCDMICFAQPLIIDMFTIDWAIPKIRDVLLKP